MARGVREGERCLEAELALDAVTAIRSVIDEADPDLVIEGRACDTGADQLRRYSHRSPCRGSAVCRRNADDRLCWALSRVDRRSVGVSQPSVLRGLLFSSAATAFSCSRALTSNGRTHGQADQEAFARVVSVHTHGCTSLPALDAQVAAQWVGVCTVGVRGRVCTAGLHSRSAGAQLRPRPGLAECRRAPPRPRRCGGWGPVRSCGGRGRAHGRGCGRADHGIRDLSVIVVGVVWSVVGSRLTDFLKVSNNRP